MTDMVTRYDEVVSKLKTAYASIMKRICDPLDSGTLCGAHDM